MPEKPKGNQNGSQPENSTAVEFSFKDPLARFEKAPAPRPLRPGVQLSLARFGIAGLRSAAEQIPVEADTPKPVGE